MESQGRKRKRARLPKMENTEQVDRKPLNIQFVSSTDSPEFSHLNSALSRTSIIRFDAESEWKPILTHHSTFPTVSLLQIAYLLLNVAATDESTEDADDAVVFLPDLSAIHVPSIYELLAHFCIA